MVWTWVKRSGTLIKTSGGWVRTKAPNRSFILGATAGLVMGGIAAVGIYAAYSYYSPKKVYEDRSEELKKLEERVQTLNTDKENIENKFKEEEKKYGDKNELLEKKVKLLEERKGIDTKTLEEYEALKKETANQKQEIATLKETSKSLNEDYQKAKSDLEKKVSETDTMYKDNERLNKLKDQYQTERDKYQKEKDDAITEKNKALIQRDGFKDQYDSLMKKVKPEGFTKTIFEWYEIIFSERDKLLNDNKNISGHNQRLIKDNERLVKDNGELSQKYAKAITGIMTENISYHDLKELLRKKGTLINEGTRIEEDFVKRWLDLGDDVKRRVYCAHLRVLNENDKKFLEAFVNRYPFTEENIRALPPAIWRRNLKDPYSPDNIMRYETLSEKNGRR